MLPRGGNKAGIGAQAGAADVGANRAPQRRRGRVGPGRVQGVPGSGTRQLGGIGAEQARSERRGRQVSELELVAGWKNNAIA